MSEAMRSLSRRSFLGATGGALGVVAAAGFGSEPLAAAAPQALERPVWRQTSDTKIRIGIVGGGFGSAFQWHLHPNCIVEAVSDLQPERRKHLMQVYKCAKSYESLEELVLDKDLDAVGVYTDAPSHGRHVVLAMNNGKHVISAVPAAFTLEDCAMIKETKQKTGLKYMMCETSYYRPEVIRARNLFRQGSRLIYSEGQYYHNNVTALDSYGKWRRALPPMFYPTHSTAFYIGVTGKRLTQVMCFGWCGHGEEWEKNQYNNPFVNESASFRTSENTTFRCNVFWKCNAGGETGLAIWESEPKVQVPNSVPLPPGMQSGSHGGSHGPLANEFIMALVEDREPAVDVYEALALTAPGLVAHESALRSGELLAVPSFDKT